MIELALTLPDSPIEVLVKTSMPEYYSPEFAVGQSSVAQPPLNFARTRAESRRIVAEGRGAGAERAGRPGSTKVGFTPGGAVL